MALAATAASKAAPSQAAQPGAAKARLQVAQTPLSFEANQGQTASAVKFLSRGDGYALFLTPTEAVFKLRKAAHAGQQPSVLRMKLVGADGTAKISGAEPHSGTANYFIGNDPNQWRMGVSTYGKVNYRGIYPGVDAVFYGNQRELEYDLTVAPGVDPKQIALEFSGARPKLTRHGDLVLNHRDGTVLLHRPVIYQGTGAARTPVDGSYKLAGHRVTFLIGPYDRRQPLIIDPVLSYLTYLGGSNADNIGGSTGYYPSGETNPTQGLAIDPAGNVYVTGYTCSADFPVEAPYQKTARESAVAEPGHFFTVFVSKLNATGTALVYSTYLGGSVFEQGTAIAVDSSGSAYVAGYTRSPDFPVTHGAYMTLCNGGLCNSLGPYIGFLTKLSPDGKSLVYSTYLGGQANHSTQIYAVAIDSKGQAYVAGYNDDFCWSTQPGATYCFPETAGAVLPESLFDSTYTPSAFNPGSAFVTVFDAAGAKLLYSTLYGNDNPHLHGYSDAYATSATGLTVDPSGNFYVTGSTKDAHLPTTSGAFQPLFPNAPGVTVRGFVAKFSPVNSPGGSSLIYGTYLGGRNPISVGDQTSAIAADASGNAYVTGITGSSDFPLTPGAYQATCYASCLYTGFVTKIKPDGSGLVWSTFLGNTTNPASGGYYGQVDTIGDIQVDTAGNVYVAGESAIGFPEVDPIQTTTGGQAQAFVAKLDPTGSRLLFSSLIGGGGTLGTQSAAGLAVDSQGDILLAGNTNSSGLAVTPGAFQQAFGKGQGVGAGFIARISLPSSTPAIAESGGVFNCASYQPGIVPNSCVSIKGINLSLKTDTWADAIAKGTLPLSLDGVSVSIGGQPAYLSYISPGQINAVAPNVGPGNVLVTVTNSNGTSLPVTAVVQTVQPSFFLWGSYAVACRTDYSPAVKNGTFPGLTTVPARPGDVVTFWGTGFGPTTPSVPDAVTVPFGTTYYTATAVTVTIGGAAVPVFGAALAPGYAGLYQVAIQIPTTLADGDYPVIATILGAQSPSSILLTVQK